MSVENRKRVAVACEGEDDLSQTAQDITMLVAVTLIQIAKFRFKVEEEQK